MNAIYFLCASRSLHINVKNYTNMHAWVYPCNSLRFQHSRVHGRTWFRYFLVALLQVCHFWTVNGGRTLQWSWVVDQTSAKEYRRTLQGTRRSENAKPAIHTKCLRTCTSQNKLTSSNPSCKKRRWSRYFPAIYKNGIYWTRRNDSTYEKIYSW